MSTKKITALTELSAAPAATDMIPVVDVSDTTDASSGTTKKITATNFCKGVGIGAGTTAAEPVKIDMSNGRMGIGTGSPGTDLSVYSDDAGVNAEILTAVAGAGAGDPFHTFLVAGVEEWSLGLDNSDSDSFKINNSGALGASGGSTGDKLTITTSGNVGISETTPSKMLDVYNGASGGDILCYDIYSHDGGVTTSDSRKKKLVKESPLGLAFVNELTPVQYQWKDVPKKEGGVGMNEYTKETYKRKHYGMLAQDVLTAVESVGLTSDDFAGYIYEEDRDLHGLRYNEFISPLIKAIQELSAKVTALENA